MNRRLRVGLICGGRSAEHEVSLASARSVMGAIDPAKYDVALLGITHDGRWLLGSNAMAELAAGGPNGAGAALASQAGTPRELVPGATGSKLPPLDVIFPVLHGPFGEDGTVQGLLELAGLPYVGSGVLASALAMDKLACKEICARHGLPQADFRAVKRNRWESRPAEVLAEIEQAFSYPVFVKPANLGSSIGITKAHNRAELRAALDEAARYDRRLLVEAAIPHAREIECSVLGNDEPMASVPGEVVPSNEFYDYAAKYVDGESQLLIPASITDSQAARVQELSIAAFKAIDGAGMARVDFLLNGETGDVFLNEINTIPGFTVISMYPKLWEASGIPYPELIDRLIALALERHADRARSATTYGGAISPAA